MGKGPRCHTATGGLGMNMGTITVVVVLSYRSDAGEPRAPAACRRLEDGGDCHDGADNSDQGGGAQPGGHGRSRVHLACRAGGLALATCRVWDTAARSMMATAMARPRCWRAMTTVRTVTTISQASSNRQPRTIASHW